MMSDMSDKMVGEVNGRVGERTHIVGKMNGRMGEISQTVNSHSQSIGQHPQQEGRRETSKSASGQS
jgi:hypothetical protein